MSNNTNHTLTIIEKTNNTWKLHYETTTVSEFTVSGNKKNAPAATSGNRNTSTEKWTLNAARTHSNSTVITVPANIAKKLNTQMRDNNQIFNIERPNGDNSHVIIRLN